MHESMEELAVNLDDFKAKDRLELVVRNLDVSYAKSPACIRDHLAPDWNAQEGAGKHHLFEFPEV